MTDSTLNRFLASGTAADRGAFTPSPPTPASGPDPLYLWYETDTNNLYAWEDPDWVLLISASGGLIAANNLSELTSVATAQTNLGISAFVATLLDDAAATNVLTTLGVSSFVKTILDDADAAAVRATIGAAASSGAGDVVGPASSVNLHIAQFDGTTGKLLKDGGALGTVAALDETTTAQYRANTADKALSTDQVWAAAVPVALTDAATVAVDMSAGFNFTVTLGGNRTLGNPSNTKDGQSGVIAITQDGTGSRTLAYSGNWEFAGGTAPTLSTAAGAKDLLFYQVLGSSSIFANLIKAVA